MKVCVVIELRLKRYDVRGHSSLSFSFAWEIEAALSRMLLVMDASLNSPSLSSSHLVKTTPWKKAKHQNLFAAIILHVWCAFSAPERTDPPAGD